MLLAAERKKATASFDDKLLLFAEGEKLPFAYRSPVPEITPYSCAEARMIERIGEFEISRTDKDLICKYIGKPSFFALIAPLDEESDVFDKAEVVLGYLRAAYSLELSMRCIEGFEDIILRLAERCGCLTDIYREDDSTRLSIAQGKPDSEFIAVSLPIIALMYRRISALRGFNFKITFADGLPCLVFSAKVILPDGGSIDDIPEHCRLCDIARNDEISYVFRMSEIDEECSCGQLFKLSLAICPQTVDPRGILRAPEWKMHTESILSKIDLDVPGRF
ncbi:MAG: hypothetical protein IKK74_07655 [Clostridia bacterium]|nr:hypothetical protein [Clostridia bacterium]